MEAQIITTGMTGTADWKGVTIFFFILWLVTLFLLEKRIEDSKRIERRCKK